MIKAGHKLIFLSTKEASEGGGLSIRIKLVNIDISNIMMKKYLIFCNISGSRIMFLIGFVERI